MENINGQTSRKVFVAARFEVILVQLMFLEGRVVGPVAWEHRSDSFTVGALLHESLLPFPR